MKQSFIKILCILGMTRYLLIIWLDSKDSSPIEDLMDSSPIEDLMDSSPIEDLMEFSGYYQLIADEDGFFVIDTVADFTFGKPTIKIFLLVNLDPKNLNTTQYEFTGNGSGGSFKKGRLKFPDVPGKETIFNNLEFTHDVTDETETVARIRSGSIKLPGKCPEDVTGSTTVFNPIKYSLFKGKYFQQTSFLSDDSNQRDEDLGVRRVSGLSLEIMEDSSVWSIRWGGTTGNNYVNFSYNFISQKFQFETLDKEILWLFMSIHDASLAVLLLQPNNNANTIKFRNWWLTNSPSPPSTNSKQKSESEESEELAKYSGYYELKDNPGQFFSVVGQVNEANNWKVQLAYCQNGTSPSGCVPSIFDSSTMTFEHNRLINSNVNINFTRVFSDSMGSLVQFNGSYFPLGPTIGYSFFNPRSLANIGGSGYKIDSFSNAKRDINLTINSENQIIFNGTQLSEFEYVPISGTLISQNNFFIFRWDSSRIRGNSNGIVCFYIDGSVLALELFALP